MKRKRSLRDSYADKCRANGETPSLKRTPLAKKSRKQTERMKEYQKVRRSWLDDPKNAVCAFCIKINPEHPRGATEVHHARGRNSTLISDTRFFIASCRFHREWPHENPEQARAWNLLSSAADWNTPLKDSGN